MDALVLWREAALAKGPQMSSRPVSPVSDDDRRHRTRSIETEDALSSGDERPLVQRAATADVQPQKKPSSSSWVRWWSRSHRDADTASARPELRPIVSEPPLSDAVRSRDQ